MLWGGDLNTRNLPEAVENRLDSWEECQGIKGIRLQIKVRGDERLLKR